MGCHSCEHPGRLCVATAARGRGEVAELAAARKCQKYADIPSAYTFLPIAMKILGSVNDSAYHFFDDLGHKISEVSGESRKASFIFQQLSITIQRSPGMTIQTSSHSTFAFNLFLCFNPWKYITSGKKIITEVTVIIRILISKALSHET